MEGYYKLSVAGLERNLKKYAVNESLDIAAFILFGDVELTEKCAAAMIPLLPEHDIMIVAEAKGIPLIHELARQMGENTYVVARKAPKVYMTDPLTVNVHSITTNNVQTLCIGQEDVEKLKGKRVLIVDDVISTGDSLAAVVELVRQAGGNIVGQAAVLAEGDAAQRKDIIFLEKLPLFFKN